MIDTFCNEFGCPFGDDEMNHQDGVCSFQNDGYCRILQLVARSMGIK